VIVTAVRNYLLFVRNVVYIVLQLSVDFYVRIQQYELDRLKISQFISTIKSRSPVYSGLKKTVDDIPMAGKGLE